MAKPPVYEDALFELSIDLSYNSLDSTFKGWVENCSDEAMKDWKMMQK